MNGSIGSGADNPIDPGRFSVHGGAELHTGRQHNDLGDKPDSGGHFCLSRPFERLRLQESARFGNGLFTPSLKPASDPVRVDRQQIGLVRLPAVDHEVKALQGGSSPVHNQPLRAIVLNYLLPLRIGRRRKAGTLPDALGDLFKTLSLVGFDIEIGRQLTGTAVRCVKPIQVHDDHLHKAKGRVRKPGLVKGTLSYAAINSRPARTQRMTAAVARSSMPSNIKTHQGSKLAGSEPLAPRLAI